MSEEKRIIFDKRIEELNNIIIQDDVLNNVFEDFVKTKKKVMLSNFYPFTNRYARALCNRNLLPSFWNKKKALAIKNMVECEAHRDVLMNVLK